MRQRSLPDRRCSMLVVLDEAISGVDELREFAAYLSGASLHGLDVVVVDTSPWFAIEQNRRVLRWVSRYRAATGAIDPVRAAIELARCEKVIVADALVRYDREALEAVCALLDLHEVVEPENYYEPLPWWGGIDAAGLLVRRGIGPPRERAATFAFRKSAGAGLRGIGFLGEGCLCRLGWRGAEVFAASGVFVRRVPQKLQQWFRDWTHRAETELVTPPRAALFCSIVPLAWLLAMFGGWRWLALYAVAIGLGSLAMAVRGRIGAGRYYPLRACLFAPLSVLERSISIYWALLWTLSGDVEPALQPSRRPVERRFRIIVR